MPWKKIAHLTIANANFLKHGIGFFDPVSFDTRFHAVKLSEQVRVYGKVQHDCEGVFWEWTNRSRCPVVALGWSKWGGPRLSCGSKLSVGDNRLRRFGMARFFACAAAVMVALVAGSSADAGHRHRGASCCAPEPACAAPAPSCCAPEPSCCEPVRVKKHRCRKHRHNDCCAPASCSAPVATCCAPAPAPTCCAPAPVATCCAPAPTCAAPAPASCAAPEAVAPAPAVEAAPAPAPAPPAE